VFLLTGHQQLSKDFTYWTAKRLVCSLFYAKLGPYWAFVDAELLAT
jgi:hypothetical protein